MSTWKDGRGAGREKGQWRREEQVREEKLS